MNQRGVALVADYLSQRPKGRIVRVVPASGGTRFSVISSPGEPDYLVAIEDVRDGRTHVVQTKEELETWLRSFREGRCYPASYGICELCSRTHSDRGLDLEVMPHCLRCTVELIEIQAERE